MKVVKGIKWFLRDVGRCKTEIGISLVPVAMVCFFMATNLDSYLSRLSYYLCIPITRDSLMSGDVRSWSIIGWIDALCALMFFFTYSCIVVRNKYINPDHGSELYRMALNISSTAFIVYGVIVFYFHNVIFYI